MTKIEHILQQEVRDNIRQDAIFHKGEVFTYFDEGSTRHVYVNADKTKVIKILIRKDTIDYNLTEAKIYDNASDEVKGQMAKTELTMDGLLIEQEFCNPIKFDDRKLTIPQIRFAKSCRDEVGWNKDGELVCFDLDEFKRY